MQPDIIQKYNKPVPRYTSYPPANFFAAFTADDYLQAVDASNEPSRTTYPSISTCPSAVTSVIIVAATPIP